VTTDEALAAISSVAPALEVIERRGDFAGDLNLALADNAQQKAFVTGEATALRSGGDLADATVDVFVNGQHSERASGTEVMGTPAASVAWLANTLAGFGLRLHAGMRVMSGSFTRQYAVNRGDRVEARFVPFGPVSADFR
jgi:2-keto-4-pentenoate hydratase